MNKTKTVSQEITNTSGNDSNDSGRLLQLDGEQYKVISDSNAMPEFMMSLSSSSNHWMFVSSYGALTAGRRNSNNALFPYYSADKIVDTRKQTGPQTIVRVNLDGKVSTWQPFWETEFDTSCIQRNLYKTPLGNKLCFEEVNSERGLTFRYRWTFSHNYGFIRTARLINHGNKSAEVDMVDGVKNIVPFGVDESFQLQFGNLIDAYKKNELTETGMGVYYLSSIPTDRAEPSEGLRASVAWTTRQPKTILLSQQQIGNFKDGQPIKTETDVRGRRGDYLLNYNFELEPGKEVDWDIVFNTELDQTDVVDLAAAVQSDDIRQELYEDIARCEFRLKSLIAKADGYQASGKAAKSLRHQSNVLFNVMRGGVPAANYEICLDDFAKHVKKANSDVANRNSQMLQDLPETIERKELFEIAAKSNDKDLLRIVNEYLPLVFSRRHGDPTRPWNKFSIESHVATDKFEFNYQGNWRDIFQNWEALAYSFPEFIDGMICRFVNASTADGYNPYRVTKNGFEWEVPEPENPWANIGYWSDHQIIYLCKLLEVSNQFFPGKLNDMLKQDVFVYANVPYRIKPVTEILADPRNTVEFDRELSIQLEESAEQIGNDAKLLADGAGNINTATLAEKLLLPLLIKLSNFVPDGGVWLNTQRPEWNDANNALVGYGLSIVTTCYLRRYVSFLSEWLQQTDFEDFEIQKDISWLMNRIQLAISPYVVANESSISSAERHQIVLDLGTAGSNYRSQLYERGLSNEKDSVAKETILNFFDQCLRLLDSTIANNRRADGLYHSYNLMSLDVEGEIQIERLYEMLEGQVAVLSSGYLTAKQSVEVLDALKESNLYRDDQSSYMLYPNRDLPRFTQKNLVSSGLVNQSPLLQELLRNGDESIIRKDIFGNCHFNGDFRNSSDVEKAVAKLCDEGEYKEWIEGAGDQIANIFENVFCHHQFTGRSGTFFAYEGLGSIYWHMVSKLLLAVSEIYVDAVNENADEKTLTNLQDHFVAIQAGIGAEKSPAEYGAFPSDPYSHTPENAGVQQPGMTGQVKEDILSRFAEIGLRIEGGRISFEPSLLPGDEFLNVPATIPTWCFESETVKELSVEKGCFAFTFCGVPIIYKLAEKDEISVHRNGSNIETVDSNVLGIDHTQELFSRSGSIQFIRVDFDGTKT